MTFKLNLPFFQRHIPWSTCQIPLNYHLILRNVKKNWSNNLRPINRYKRNLYWIKLFKRNLYRIKVFKRNLHKKEWLKALVNQVMSLFNSNQYKNPFLRSKNRPCSIPTPHPIRNLLKSRFLSTVPLNPYIFPRLRITRKTPLWRPWILNWKQTYKY